MDVSKRLRDLMDKCGITQYRLCKESGLNQSSVSRYLNGLNSPTTEQLEKICTALGISIAEFFSDADQEPPAQFDALHQLIEEIPEERRDEVRRFLEFTIQQHKREE